MDVGNEIKRDVCPQKYYEKGSVMKDTLSIVAVTVVISLFSGNLLEAGGLNTVVTLLIEALFVVVMYAMCHFLLKGSKVRLAETYISICENGICGVYPINGMKNGNFSLMYSEITKLSVKNDRLIIFSNKGRIILTLVDAQGSAALINSRMHACS